SFIGMAPPQQVWMQAGDVNGLTAYWQQETVWAPLQLTTTSNPAAGGSLTPSCPTPAGCYYNTGTPVLVSAAPNSGYTFTGFSGALTGTSNPQTLNITSNSAVTAAFQSLFTMSSQTNSASIGPGGSAQFSLTITQIGSAQQTVSLSASGMPQGMSAQFSPS